MNPEMIECRMAELETTISPLLNDQANLFNTLDGSGYVRYGYAALHNLFQQFDVWTPEEVHARAYAVYGWMPTILRTLPDDENIKNLSNLVNSGLPGLIEDNTALTAINNSVVGTSKFLHFSRPDVFPIWDRRVARACNGHEVANGFVENTNNYATYTRSVHDWLKTGALRANFLHAIEQMTVGRKPLTGVRKVELALFWWSRLTPAAA